MAGVRVRMNPKGARAILRSPEVLAELRRRADRVATVAGDGMEADGGVGPRRARASVRTATIQARRREAKSKALTRALDAGRG